MDFGIITVYLLVSIVLLLLLIFLILLYVWASRKTESSTLLLQFYLAVDYWVEDLWLIACPHYYRCTLDIAYNHSSRYCLDLGFMLIHACVQLFVKPHISASRKLNVYSENDHQSWANQISTSEKLLPPPPFIIIVVFDLLDFLGLPLSIWMMGLLWWNSFTHV